MAQQKKTVHFGENAIPLNCIEMEKQGSLWVQEKQVLLLEDEPCGIAFLRDQMEGVEPEDVEKKGIRWIATRYLLMSGCIPLLYSDEIFDDSSNLLGRYAFEMGKVLKRHGIDFKPLEGITEEGIKKLNEIDPR